MLALTPLTSERAALLARLPTEPLSYAAVSGVALAADTGAYLALAWLGLLPALAGAAGYLIGLALHYALSVTFVFDAQATGKSPHRLIVEFGASGLAGLLLTAAAIAFSTGILGLSLVAAKSIAVIASFAAVYALRRFVVFAAR
jgi:putative flippase GtrA